MKGRSGGTKTSQQTSYVGPTDHSAVLKTRRRGADCGNARNATTTQLPKKTTTEQPSADKSSLLKTIRSGRQPSETVSQADVDLQYARYIQVAYLEAMASRAAKQEEELTRAELLALYQKLAEERAQLTAAQAKLAACRASASEAYAVNAQSIALQGLMERIQEIEFDVQGAGAALGCIRQHLPVSGVRLPEETDTAKVRHWEEQMAVSLVESANRMQFIVHSLEENKGIENAQRLETAAKRLEGNATASFVEADELCGKMATASDLLVKQVSHKLHSMHQQQQECDQDWPPIGSVLPCGDTK